jgi:uridylate kinase
VSKESGAEDDPGERRSNSGKPRAGRDNVYARVLLKITGEAFEPPARLRQVVRDIAAAARSGCELAVVVGGGNIMRGRQTTSIDRVSADQAGMVATIINGIVLDRMLQAQGTPARHLSAFEIAGVVPLYSASGAIEALSRKQVVVLSGGTGNPLFSTDTTAALRAREIGADAILKGTKVEGVYTSDPKRDPKARFLPRLSYEAAMRKRLGVMDAAAFALGSENRIPIVVFHLFRAGNLTRVIKGAEIGSKIC